MCRERLNGTHRAGSSLWHEKCMKKANTECRGRSYVVVAIKVEWEIKEIAPVLQLESSE